jgi:hypothetical protein
LDPYFKGNIDLFILEHDFAPAVLEYRQKMNKNPSKAILKIINNITPEQKGSMIMTLNVGNKDGWISKENFINAFKNAKISAN